MAVAVAEEEEGDRGIDCCPQSLAAALHAALPQEEISAMIITMGERRGKRY